MRQTERITELGRKVRTLISQSRIGDWDGYEDKLYYRLNDAIWFYKEGDSWKQGDTGDPVGWESGETPNGLDELSKKVLELKAERARQALDREMLGRTG